MNAAEQKKSIRQSLRGRLSELSPEKRQAASEVIRQKLFALGEFRTAAHVCFYVALPNEVDTRPMIDEALEIGKRVFVPLTDFAAKEIRLYEIEDRSELEPGTLGIPEPSPKRSRSVPADEADLVLVPGLGFDKSGNRIGRGAGLYDRFLKKLRPDAPKIGLAFSSQIVELGLPVEAHDVRLDRVITEIS